MNSVDEHPSKTTKNELNHDDPPHDSLGCEFQNNSTSNEITNGTDFIPCYTILASDSTGVFQIIEEATINEKMESDSNSHNTDFQNVTAVNKIETNDVSLSKLEEKNTNFDGGNNAYEDVPLSKRIRRSRRNATPKSYIYFSSSSDCSDEDVKTIKNYVSQSRISKKSSTNNQTVKKELNGNSSKSTTTTFTTKDASKIINSKCDKAKLFLQALHSSFCKTANHKPQFTCLVCDTFYELWYNHVNKQHLSFINASTAAVSRVNNNTTTTTAKPQTSAASKSSESRTETSNVKVDETDDSSITSTATPTSNSNDVITPVVKNTNKKTVPIKRNNSNDDTITPQTTASKEEKESIKDETKDWLKTSALESTTSNFDDDTTAFSYDSDGAFSPEVVFSSSEDEIVVKKPGVNKSSKVAPLPKLYPNDKSAFQCNTCNKKFNYRFQLRRHIRQVHDGVDTKKPIETSNLKGESASSSVADTSNEKNDTNNDSMNSSSAFYSESRKVKASEYAPHCDIENHGFKCLTCHKDFLNRLSLMSHIKRIHILERKTDCPKCGKVICKRYMDRHMETHDENRQFHPCQVCAKSFMSSIGLKLHMLVHAENRPQYQCKECDKKLSTYSSFSKHKKLHKYKKDLAAGRQFAQKVRCNICGLECATDRSLHNHKNKWHSDSRYECADCGKEFRVRTYLIRHVQKHMNVRHPCRLCDRVYKDPLGLRYHMLSHEAKKCLCFSCGKLFHRPDSLKKHQVEVHSGTKPYVCEYCGTKFTRKGNMKMHLKRHLFRNDEFVQRRQKSAAASNVVVADGGVGGGGRGVIEEQQVFLHNGDGDGDGEVEVKYAQILPEIAMAPTTTQNNVIVEEHNDMYVNEEYVPQARSNNDGCGIEQHLYVNDHQYVQTPVQSDVIEQQLTYTNVHEDNIFINYQEIVLQ